MTKEIEYEGDRIETGPVRIGDDWTGIFMRGDDALPLAMFLRQLLEKYDAELTMEDAILMGVLRGHIELLESCVEGVKPNEDTV